MYNAHAALDFYFENLSCRYITMEAGAKHDFNATAEDELSFRKGQILKVWLSVMVLLHWGCHSHYCVVYK